jgi:hypothetical protein
VCTKVFDLEGLGKSAREGDMVAELCFWHDACPVGSLESPLVHRTLQNATASTEDMEWSDDVHWASQAGHEIEGR